MPADINDTIEAADQVACEFIHEQRVQFITQAITREHEHVSEQEAVAWAHLFVEVG